MAKIQPPIEVIEKRRTPLTAGENFLLHALSESLDDSCEVFVEPYLNGDRPDFVIVRKDIGVLIVEVKDWTLNGVEVDEKNNWLRGSFKQKVKSPHQQAFEYKKNIFELHCGVLGLNRILNRNHFKIIDTCVFLYDESADRFLWQYDANLKSINEQRKAIRSETIGFLKSNTTADKQAAAKNTEKDEFLKRCHYKLKRDRDNTYTRNKVDELIDRIHTMKAHRLFEEASYDDLIRRLKPPVYTTNQQTPVSLKGKQIRLAQSRPGKYKIKGVAGCGKSVVLAQRAINSHNRYGSEVLILSYNITLTKSIRDKLSRQNQHIDSENYRIQNYHEFIRQQVNRCQIDFPVVDEAQSAGQREAVFEEFYSNVNLFDGTGDNPEQEQIEKFDSIFVDELQDYRVEWLTILEKYFLKADGEFVVFGDQQQTIYDHEEVEEDSKAKKSYLAKHFSPWETFTTTYRQQPDTPLVHLFKAFQERYLTPKYDDSDVFDTQPFQAGLSFNILKFIEDLPPADIASRIMDICRADQIPPNDVAIISSKFAPLKPIREIIGKHEALMINFETDQELAEFKRVQPRADEEECIRQIRRAKKNFFEANDGTIKMSSIHSFKGLEAHTVFCILAGDEKPEVVFTAITRATHNLVIFSKSGSEFDDFFKTAIN